MSDHADVPPQNFTEVGRDAGYVPYAVGSWSAPITVSGVSIGVPTSSIEVELAPAARDGIDGRAIVIAAEDLTAASRAPQGVVVKVALLKLQDRFLSLIEAGCAKIGSVFLSWDRGLCRISKGVRGYRTKLVLFSLNLKLLQAHILVLKLSIVIGEQRNRIACCDQPCSEIIHRKLELQGILASAGLLISSQEITRLFHHIQRGIGGTESGSSAAENISEVHVSVSPDSVGCTPSLGEVPGEQIPPCSPGTSFRREASND